MGLTTEVTIVVLVGFELTITVHTARQTRRVDLVLVSARVVVIAPVELAVTGHLTVPALECRLGDPPTRATALHTKGASFHGSRGTRLDRAHLVWCRLVLVRGRATRKGRKK